MKKKFIETYPLETQTKVKKHLVWLFIVSVTMIFAGLTSAYIVSMGDNFWVKVNLPKEFFISTALIIISSLALFIAERSLKAHKVKRTQSMVVIALILGIGFGVFQFLGYRNLVGQGAHFVSSIIVDDGRYGDYYEIKIDGEYLTIENNQYHLNGEKLSSAEMKKLQEFASQFLVKDLEELKSKNIDYSYFTLLYKSEPLSLVNGEFIRPGGEKLQMLDFDRLYSLALNIKDGRADFFVRGEMGKDFKLLYNGNELDYQERTLMYKGKALSANLQNKLLRGNSDKSTSYFYIITVLHLLHVIGGVLALMLLTRRTYTVKNESKLAMHLRVNSIFWHYLGVLWVYLLLFLVFIH